MEVQPDQPHPQAADIAAGLDGLFALLRWLSPPGLSLTANSTLATLERSGPGRLTALATGQGVSQPAMTQLVSRLAEDGLVTRSADPADGRVVHVQITDLGRDYLASRRAARAARLSGLLATLSQGDQDALAAALPAIRALASAERDGRPAGARA
jgi:DNA-binding MarR family transcriptional regulator